MNQSDFANRAQLAQQFKNTFGVPLSEYWDGFGLDIARFDDNFIRSGDKSMSEVITNRFGPAATELVRKLL